MNLEQYAAQQTQATQGAQNAPQTQEPLDALAAQIDAGRLYSLQAEAQAAIDSKAPPAAILERITGALWGQDSPQAAAVATIIDEYQNPGGRELAAAIYEQQRKAIHRQQKNLEKLARSLADELEKINAAEAAARREESERTRLNRALLDVMTFATQLDAENPRADLLQAMAGLYERHQGSPAAMGLLYGCIADLNRRQYSAAAFDLVQQQEFKDLAARIAAAIGL